MPLSEAFLDELKARIALPELIGRRVRLVRSGRELKGCCPFHNEKTPSFHVFADHYHCFGCGAHGDAIRFLMETEGQDFMGAVRALAAEAGLEVPETRARPEEARRARLREAVAVAAAWFAEQLAGPGGAHARAYLASRGVDAELARAFGLGWAPAGGLEAAVRARLPCADRALLAEAGLVTDEGRQRFRERLIFPIRDPRGRPLGFGGRLLGAGEPKYLNSADGPLFHKGRLLFNLDRAAAPARKAGRLILVEGYMDVIGLARAGIAEAVAPLGTALTEAQLELAWRVVAEPVLAFDGDAAGLKAATRAGQLALARIGPGRSLRVALLAAGEDPDDLARRGGAAAVEALVASAVPLERFLFERAAAEAPLDTPERRADFRRRLADLTATIGDPELRRDYRDTWRARADRLLDRDDRPGRPGGRGGAPARAARVATRAAPSTRAYMQGALLHALALRPEGVARHLEALAEVRFASPVLDAARDALLAGQAPELPAWADGRALAARPQAAFDEAIAAALASYLVHAHMAESAKDGPGTGATGRTGKGVRDDATGDDEVAARLARWHRALAETRERLLSPVLGTLADDAPDGQP
mgnify:CR=1 FL=1